MPLNSILTLAALLGIVAAVVFHQFYWPGVRLRRIQRREFPRNWESSLLAALPVFDRLTDDLQEQLKNLIKQFIAEKQFIGCAGMVISDEIRLTVAANACLLLLNRNSGCFPELNSVLVYPTTFVVSREQQDEFGLVSTDYDALVGESWSAGKIILAWDEVQRGVRNFGDGENVVLHEFAHELDHEDGASNGAPILRNREAYETWARTFAREFSDLQELTHRGQNSVLDEYGATNPAEFFAVATETFFEKPLELRARHNELYQQLAAYYQVDPAQWVVNA